MLGASSHGTASPSAVPFLRTAGAKTPGANFQPQEEKKKRKSKAFRAALVNNHSGWAVFFSPGRRKGLHAGWSGDVWREMKHRGL